MNSDHPQFFEPNHGYLVNPKIVYSLWSCAIARGGNIPQHTQRKPEAIPAPQTMDFAYSVSPVNRRHTKLLSQYVDHRKHRIVFTRVVSALCTSAVCGTFFFLSQFFFQLYLFHIISRNIQ